MRREGTWANISDTRGYNKPKNSNRPQAINIYTINDLFTQRQAEGEVNTPNKNQRGNMGLHDSREMVQPPCVFIYLMYLGYSEEVNTISERATSYSRCIFIESEYGTSVLRYKFFICYHLWFLRDLDEAAVAMAAYPVRI